MTTERPLCMTLDLLIALGKLTPEEREVVVDRNMLGRSFKAIAATLGITRQGAHVIEHRGLRKLRELLGVPK